MVKYEGVFLRDYLDVDETTAGFGKYFRFYNRERSHRALGYRTPEDVYFARAECLRRMTRLMEIRRKRIPTAACKTLLSFAPFPTGPTAAVTNNGAFFNGGDPP